MKKFALYFICFLVIQNAMAQNCEISETLRFYYQEDVKYLALKRMDDFNAPARDSIRIPEIWMDSIWEGMSAIFNELSPAAEEVFYEYCVHQLIKPVSGSFIVALYDTTAWIENWSNGILATGDPFLDSIFLEYGIDSVSSGFITLPFYTLHHDQFLNENALADLIEMHPQVDFAAVDHWAGDGERIDYNLIDNTQYYDFSVGWGDCPAGCIYRYYWRFEVDENCQVTSPGTAPPGSIPFEGERCDLLPPLNTSSPSNELPITLFPNPVETSLRVNTDRPGAVLTYELYHQTGRLLRADRLATGEELSLAALPSGVYLLRLREAASGRVVTKKLVKH